MIVYVRRGDKGKESEQALLFDTHCLRHPREENHGVSREYLLMDNTWKRFFPYDHNKDMMIYALSTEYRLLI